MLENGVDINTVGIKVKNKRKNEYTPTPLIWLFLTQEKNIETLKMFKYLLDNGADPMVVFEKYNSTMLFEAAGYKYPDYLRLILSSKQIEKNDLNIDLNTGTMNTPLLHAMATNRFENFKLLLDAGADMNWIEERTGRTTLHYCATDGDWKYAYELLTRGVNYEKDLKSIIGTIEAENNFSAITSINWRGTDDRQKIVQFFRKKGINIKPGMDIGEKYVTENGKDVFYVNEKFNKTGEPIKEREDKWVKFEDSVLNEHTAKNPDEQHYLDKEIEKIKVEELK